MLFHQNNKLILFPMNGKVRPWSKVLFSPLFPDSLLCNMYAKRCLAPQQLSTTVKCSIFLRQCLGTLTLVDVKGLIHLIYY